MILSYKPISFLSCFKLLSVVFYSSYLSYATTLYPQRYAACETKGVMNSNPCISINSFADFKMNVENVVGTVVFCPFTISKRSDEIASIYTNIQLICKKSKECQISGSSTHIEITKVSAQVFLQGFVFKGATSGAIHITSSAQKRQSFCNCLFIENRGTSRGMGLLIERGTDVVVNSCRFQNNKSTDIGGSIFNRGSLVVTDTTFDNNEGQGGAIGNAPRAMLTLESNRFVNNIAGLPILLHDKSYIDQGKNLAGNNFGCNGLWIDGGGKGCIEFLPQSIERSLPKPKQETENAPRGGIGYFNYDIGDNKFGPINGWGEVTGNPEQLRYQELLGTLKRSLVNKCNWKYINQSPIDLCESKINKDCQEYHQTRTHSGNIDLSDKQVKAQILPSKLRLKYYPDRPPVDGPFPPEADFANNWNGFAEVNHIDIKIPSEHSICGAHYPAEYSIYMVHPLRRQTIVMSIFLTYDAEDKDNDHLQIAIDEWQKVFNENEMRCQTASRKKLIINNTTISLQSKSNTKGSKEVRYLKDETPFGKGGWDPFHPSLERTIYFWGYWGSLTEPPCSNFVAWRVLTEPAYISKRQLEQMKTLLFSNRNTDCQYTTVNHRQSVARPIQPNRGRLLHKCTVNDFVSDKDKKAMREKTGDPNWCC